LKTILAILLLLVPAVSFAADTIVVPVTLTYQGRSVQAIMAIDTGATRTTIGILLAVRLGIKDGIKEGTANGLAEMADGSVVRYQTVTMDVTADVLTKRMPVNVMEYAGGGHVDGLLGMDFLSQLPMVIDWKRGMITWIRE
jgi:predicted aspartyl protease